MVIVTCFIYKYCRAMPSFHIKKCFDNFWKSNLVDRFIVNEHHGMKGNLFLIWSISQQQNINETNCPLELMRRYMFHIFFLEKHFLQSIKICNTTTTTYSTPLIFIIINLKERFFNTVLFNRFTSIHKYINPNVYPATGHRLF